VSTFDELVSVIEAKPYFSFPFEIANEFLEVCKWAKEQMDELLHKKAAWEYLLFSLHTKNPLLKFSEPNDQRFTFSFQYSDGSKWPDPDGFDEEAMKYFLDRMQTTSNVFLRSRYADYLFEYGVKPLGIKQYDIARELVPSFISVCGAHVDGHHNNHFQGLADLYRAIEVALKMRNAEFLNPGISALRSLLFRYEEKEEYRWILYVSRILRLIQDSPLRNELAEDLRTACMDALSKAAKAYEAGEDATISPHFFGELIEWGRLGSFTGLEIGRIQTLIGELYEKHAEKQDSFLAKAHFYEKALTHYVQQGIADKVNPMKVQIREAYRNLRSSGELKGFVVPFQLPAEYVKGVQAQFVVDDLEEAIDRISSGSHHFYPQVDDVAKATVKRQEAAPMLSFIHKSMLGDERKLFQTETDDDLNQQAFAEQYILDLSMRTEVFLTPIFQRLILEKGLTANAVLRKLEAWPLLHADNSPFLTDGIRKFFDRDYVGCIHILAPQFESTLRRAFSLKRYPTTSLRRGAVQHEETFNVFLERTDVQDALGTDLHRFIQMVMVDHLGLNLRNEVGHGLISFEKCNQSHCAQMILLFLALTAIDIPDPNTSGNNGPASEPGQ